MWSFRTERKDARSGRVVFLIECLLNQNARDSGAAESAATTRAVIDLLADKQVGMVQIPCPEIACLGFTRKHARLARRGLRISFHGMRDADPDLLAEDLDWPRGRL